MQWLNSPTIIGLFILTFLSSWFALCSFYLAGAIKHWRAGGVSRFIDWGVGLISEGLIVVLLGAILAFAAQEMKVIPVYLVLLFLVLYTGWALRSESIHDVRLYKTYVVRFSRRSWEWWYSGILLVIVGLHLVIMGSAFLLDRLSR